ncbi:MAG: HAMP domain-containing histidine kinase, partial [Phycisphaerales bacterium]|nr:HAMP domain-containing histidine kinase [Phycisphaerales bacterium]
LIPTSLIVPLICGGLVQLGEELGWFSERVGETLITVFSAVSFSLLAWWLARTVESHLVERIGFQKSLGRAGRELDRRKRELEQFAFTISHDLKSPLVSIRGFLGLMQKDIQDGRIEDAVDSANEVGDAAGHMNDIIDGILVYSRLGRIDEDPTEIDVEELMDAIVDLHRPQSDEVNAVINVAPNVPSCFGYRASIRRALDNLYANALKYAGAEGRPKIELGGFTVDGECHYYVKDNGPGIAPEYHDKVFELFHRLDTDKSGTGLGLASVAKIAEVHQGRAWVESTPGRGATFVIAIPCDGTDLKGVD